MKKRRDDNDWEIIWPMVSYFILLSMAVGALILGMNNHPMIM